MLEKTCHPVQKEDRMSDALARVLCRKLQNGGITLPDKNPAFQGKR